MAKILIDYFKRMRIGAKYKKMIRNSFHENICDDSNLFVGAKIKYNAQSTFHTID